MGQADRFRRQARACADLGSPLYAALLSRAADDIDAGGVTAGLLAGYEDAPQGAAVALRLTGAVHRLVLSGEEPRLAAHYPSAGGTYVAGDESADEEVWRLFRAVLLARPGPVRETLRRPPQTNETGRSLPLLGALAVVSARCGGLPVRLVEIGASAGLNLRADALRAVHRAGDLEDLPVGRPYDVVQRLGCDVDPVDPTTADGRLTLMSYVWPDDLVRLRRLRTALDVAALVPAEVKAAGAAELLRGVDVEPGAVLVVWHSVMWQYLPAGEQQDVLAELDRLAGRAAASSPVAHVSFEPAARDSSAFEVRLRLADGSTRSDDLLGTAPPHGVPVTWAVGS